MTGVNLGAQELLIVLVIVLVIFGGSKLPKLARSLGQAQNEFKQGMNDPAPDDDEPEASRSSDQPTSADPRALGGA